MSFETFMSPTWPDTEAVVPANTQEMYADPSDWVSLLQRVALQIDIVEGVESPKPFDAHMERRVVEISKKFYDAQPIKLQTEKQIQGQVRDPLTILFTKMSYFYDLLLLDTDHINPHVTPSAVQVGLLSIDDEMRQVFKDYEIGFKLAYTISLPYWQSRSRSPELKNLLASLLKVNHKNYGKIILVFKLFLQREKAFLNQRIALKERCKAQLPPEVYQTFLNWILPILQQRHMVCIEPLKVQALDFMNTQGRTPDSISIVNILLNNIKSQDDIAPFTATLARLAESPARQIWMRILIVLQRSQGKRFTFDWIHLILDKLVVHTDKLDLINSLVRQASNLSLQQLLEILTLNTIQEMHDALALADSAFRLQQQLQAEMENITCVLSTLLDSRLMTTSVCHTLWRDYLYVKALIHAHPVYYYTHNNDRDLEESRQQLVLSTASLKELKVVLVKILMTEADPKLPQKEVWRTTLQMVALLHTLYTRTAGCVPSDKQLFVLLTILKKPHVQSQVLFDISAEDQAIILEVLTALYCLRSGIVYIEKAEERLLLDNNPRMKAFFDSLSLSLHKHPTDFDSQLTFVTTAHQHGARAVSCHYLDQHTVQRNQLPSIARKDDLNAYSARAWTDMKIVVLRHFDALCRLISHDEPSLNSLQHYREMLLNTLNLAWQGFFNELKAETVEACDTAFVQFQQQHLIPVWTNSLKWLQEFAVKLRLPVYVRQRLDCLYARAEHLGEDLRQRPYRMDELQDSTGTSRDQTFVKHDVVGAILKYDHAVLTDTEKQPLAEQHFQKQLSQLLSMCSQGDNASLMPYARLKSLIEYLEKTIQTTELTLDLLAVVLYTTKLYHSLAFETDEHTEKVAELTRVANAYCVKAIARDTMQRFQWVTQKTTYYYQWFECRAVKEAAEAVYALAEEVTVAPDNQDVVKAFYRSLYYHKMLLSQTNYYPWSWFFGYSDPCRVLNHALTEFQDLVTLGSCSKSMKQEAKESALSAFYLTTFETRLQSIQVSKRQKTEWQTVLAQIKTLKEQYRGLGLLVELKQYMRTQQHKFMCRQQSFCFSSGAKQDKIDGLLVHIEQALTNIQQRAVLNDRLYLSQKEAVLQAALGPTVESVSIRPGCVAGQDFFDVLVTTEPPLPVCLNDFQSMMVDSGEVLRRIESLHRRRESMLGWEDIDAEIAYYSAILRSDSTQSVWVKRFYSAEQFLAFTAEQPQVLDPAPPVIRQSYPIT